MIEATLLARPSTARSGMAPPSVLLPRILLALGLAVLAILGPFGKDAAAQNMKIAAIVNSDAVTEFDIAARTRLVAGTSGLPYNASTRARLRPQILRSLIDERLQLQEARRLGIQVSDAAVKGAVANIERQNRIPAGTLLRRLKGGGIDTNTFLEQMRAGLAWVEAVRRRLGPAVSVSDDQIDAEMVRLRANAGKPEYLLAEIVLAVDSPGEDQAVRKRASQLMAEIRRGASFSAIAQEFSETASASSGGNIGWVTESLLSPEMASAVRRGGKGRLIGPIRSGNGYTIALIRDRRVVGGANAKKRPPRVRLAQIALPLAKDAPADTVAETERVLREASADANNCAAMGRLARRLSSPAAVDLGWRETRSLDKKIRDAIAPLQVNQGSAPIRQPDGMLVLMICERDDGGVGASRAEVAERLQRQRIDRLAQRYLRDLRRSAFIDIKG